MKDSKKEIFAALSLISQLGLSVVISFLLWIGIASWVQRKYSLGNYIMVIGIFMGIGSAVTTFVKLCTSITGKGDKNEK